MNGTLMRNCAGCGVVFEQPRRQGRPWTKCDTCGGRSTRATVRAAAHPGDPAVPSDGSCARCGKPRRPERSVRYAGPLAELDAFCSTECAKRHYGVAFGLSKDDDETRERKVRGGEAAAARFRAKHPRSVPGVFAR